MRRVDGREIAQDIFDGLKKLTPPRKFLAVFLVGDDPSSVNFVRQKERKAKELGIDFRLYSYPPEIKNDDLRERVYQITVGQACGGAMIQLPLPSHLNPHYVFNVIPREKDVDVLSERSFGSFCAGRGPVIPPAVGAVKVILERERRELQFLKVAVVGPGTLIGKPISVWLMDKCREICIFGKESDLTTLNQADLIISGVGQASLFGVKMIKPDAGVIDFGWSVNKGGEISGDFKPPADSFDSSLVQSSGFYTPTPGGTGPIVVAKLFENFYRLNN